MAKFTRKKNCKRKSAIQHQQKCAIQKVNKNNGESEERDENLQNKTLSKLKKGCFSFRGGGDWTTYGPVAPDEPV